MRIHPLADPHGSNQCLQPALHRLLGGCIAGGRNYCHINPNGDVEPCVFIHYSGANIREASLLDALKQPLFLAYRDNQPFNQNHLRPSCWKIRSSYKKWSERRGPVPRT